jgi:hypothetical protein
MRGVGVFALAAMLIAGCQSAPPAPAEGKTTTIGNTTVTVSGRVRVEGGYVDGM